MSMYVIQVATGAERDVQRRLENNGIRTTLPIEARMIRRGGRWMQQEYVLIPGYVFVEMRYTDRLYYVLINIPQVIRVLKLDGKPVPLSESEEAYIHFLGAQVLTPSVVCKLPDGSGKPIKGILIMLRNQIVKYDFHARRALCDITLAGSRKRIALSFQTPEDGVG